MIPRSVKYDYSVCGFSPVHGDKVAVLDVYLDESGVHSNQILIVGGFVADANKWAEFSAYWKDMLKKYGLTYFRMNSYTNGRHRAFRHLNGIEKRDLLGALVAGIKQTALFSICALTKPFEYDRVATPEFKQAFGGCYSFAVRMCLIGITRLLQDPTGATETLGVFIERSPNCEAALQHIEDHKEESDAIPRWFDMDYELLPHHDDWTADDPYRESGLKIGAFGKGSKESMPPLQAADLLVFSAHAAAIGSKANAKCQGVWENIAEKVPPYSFPLTTDLLTGFVNAYASQLEERRNGKHAVAQLIREANHFGLKGEVIPYKGVDLSGSAADIRRFKQWAKEHPGHFRNVGTEKQT